MTLSIKRTLILGAVLALLVALMPFAAQAEEDTAETNDTSAPAQVNPFRALFNNKVAPEERQEQREERTQERNTLREERQAITATARENAIARIQLNLKRYVAVLEAAIHRFETLADRIQSRADKMKEDGIDVSEAEGYLADADVALEAAAADLASIRDMADADVDVTDETTPATVFGEVRELLQSAREHLREAHQALKNAVQSLRAQISADAEADADADE